MIKKALFIFVFMLTAPFVYAADTAPAAPETAATANEASSESLLEKSGDALKSGAEKTKTFIKDNFNSEKLDAFGKKAANATKKTWAETKEASKKMVDSFKSKRSCNDKKDNSACEKKEKKEACSCSCKCQ